MGIAFWYFALIKTAPEHSMKGWCQQGSTLVVFRFLEPTSQALILTIYIFLASFQAEVSSLIRRRMCYRNVFNCDLSIGKGQETAEFSKMGSSKDST